jgi:two-component system, response regulator YesN
MRIDKASQLLIETQMSIDEAAYKVGFNDRTYFRKIFKRVRGVTPSSYRHLHLKAYINA